MAKLLAEVTKRAIIEARFADSESATQADHVSAKVWAYAVELLADDEDGGKVLDAIGKLPAILPQYTMVYNAIWLDLCDMWFGELPPMMV